MISLLVSLVALVLGYLLYGMVVERIARPTDAVTPAVKLADGVDYVAMPTWRVFMIQFLNIAGTGPIFGAIMGIWFGPAAYLWIVLGCVFAGAVHDFFCGILSMRHDGAGLPVIVGRYLGKNVQQLMLVFSLVLLLIVGVVFVYSPAIILGGMWGNKLTWVMVIFVYYIIATLLPIDKLIGKVYPLFAVSLLFMALALMVVLVIKMPSLPEVWNMGGMEQWLAANGGEDYEMLGVGTFMQKNPLFPCLFITIACGAISGFHATQSPLMARCLMSERQARPIFYGAMITEGVVALIWAAVSSYFFYYGGWREVVSPETVDAFVSQFGTGEGKTLIQYFSAPDVVKLVSTGWLGVVGGFLAILGVVAAPITSGDTAFRSARLIIADFLHLNQKEKRNRLFVAVPMFVAAFLLLLWQVNNPDGFNALWQYFGWSNQSITVFTLWAMTVYLVRSKRNYLVTLVPAVFMTVVCSVAFVVSPLMLGLSTGLIPWVSAGVTVAALVWFRLWLHRSRTKA